MVTIRSAKVLPGRRGSVRKIRIPKELAEMVQAAASSHGLKTIFRPILNLFRYFDKILAEAKIEKLDPLGRKLTAHSFRHTFATMMAESVGHNPFIVKQILGHSQITTTDRYCHPTAEARIIDLAELLGPSDVSDVSENSQEAVSGVKPVSGENDVRVATASDVRSDVSKKPEQVARAS